MLIFLSIKKLKEEKSEIARKHIKLICIIPDCKIKIVIIKEFDMETKLPKVIIFLYKNKKILCFLYNDIFNYNDFIKLNSTI